jgi:hypothetical protein
MAYDYKHQNGGFENVESGISEKVWIAIKSEMDSIATPTAPFANPGDTITIVGDHTFTAGKGFLEYQLAPQKNELDYNSKGEAGNLAFSGVVKIFIPGSKAAVHEQVKFLANTPLIVLAKDPDRCDENFFYQLGCDCNSAWLSKADWKSSTTKDGTK